MGCRSDQAHLSSLPGNIAQQVAAALLEDIGSGDLTALLIPSSERGRASIVCREDAVLCGTAWVDQVFRQLDPELTLDWSAEDGAAIGRDQTICRLSGRARPILSGERTALNFLQTLSGTATLTRRYVAALGETSCVLLDTRKTVPGLRLAQKYAVRCGGAKNHRLGLYDMVLIKENHIAAAGSIAAAIAAARSTSPGIKIEVEVETLAELTQALAAAPDMVLLDELSIEDMGAAVRLNQAAGRPVRLEASGGVSFETIRDIAATGVDYISIGGLTKHVHAVDLSLRLERA